MGFIEELRQQKEAEALVRSQRETELSRKREAEDVAKQQREAQEREFHKQRRQQAEAYLQESAVEPLITELGNIINGHSGRLDKSTNGSDRSLPTLARDPDSSCIFVVWDESKVRTIKNGPRYANSTFYYDTWDVFKGKFFEVESCPDGRIILHAGLFGGSVIPLEKWKNDKRILEIGLEKAYNFPRFGQYKCNFSTTSAAA